MRVNIQGLILTATSYVPFNRNGLLHTEDPNGIVRVFRWNIEGCKLLVRYNEHSVSEIEYIEAQLKSLKDGKVSKKTNMSRFKFELSEDLTSKTHTGAVLVTDTETGGMSRSKQLEGISRDDLFKQAQDYKTTFLLHVEVLGC